MTSAWGNNGGATETEIITWKDTGCATSLLISYGIHWRRRFAFEVNGEHGSVQGWEDYSTHACDVGVVITTLWWRQLTQESGGAQLLSIISYCSTSDCIALDQLIPVPYVVLYVCVVFSQKYRSYTGINNNIIHTVHALSATYSKDRLTGGRFIRGGLLTGVTKTRGASDRRGGDWPGSTVYRRCQSKLC